MTGPNNPIAVPPSGGPSAVAVQVVDSNLPLADEQILVRDHAFQVGATRRAEGDIGRGHHYGDDEQLRVTEYAEGEGDRNTEHGGEAQQIGRDHHRTFRPVLDPGAERQGEHHADRQTGGGQCRDRARSGVQHADRDQG
ncbi:hypothetical protein [Nocardia nova]|uniref:hypothetical protein n=1 Tax=Nocardia nova TaxID=37330 RepID=UPI0025AEDF2F|nr:hypothetical protein [Nocardia nova]